MRKEHRFSFGQTKRYECRDCDYQTSSKVSMGLHTELMHPNSAITSLQSVTTTIKGVTSEEIDEDDNCKNDYQVIVLLSFNYNRNISKALFFVF